jgi:hypothetical protein
MNIILILLTVIFLLFYWYFDDLRNRYWQYKLKDKTLHPEQRNTLLKYMPIYRRMTDAQRLVLEKHVIWFLANKTFIGCGGLKVTGAMKLIVAADACVLVLNKPWPLFRNVKQILLYPSAYYANETSKDGAGLISYHQTIRQGESWPGGTLVLSWHDVLNGNRLPNDGHNLVFHEFAHQLDQETGATTGTPLLKDKLAYQQWNKEFSRAFKLLKAHIAYGMPHVIHSYGATNEAEFFAVLTETFLEKPEALKQFDPVIYDLLLEYFGFDPRHWSK